MFDFLSFSFLMAVMLLLVCGLFFFKPAGNCDGVSLSVGMGLCTVGCVRGVVHYRKMCAVIHVFFLSSSSPASVTVAHLF